MFGKIDPAPKVNVTRFGAGVHTYHKSEEGLPLGIVPPAAELHFNAIVNGYFLA